MGKDSEMKGSMLVSAFLCAGLFLACGCSTTPESSPRRAELDNDVRFAIDRAQKEDPGMARFFNSSAGYAVFPSVGKGAVGVGGAYGRGELYEKGEMTGYCTLTQASVGLALGGQTYAEFIFFEGTEALDRFKHRDFTFTAQASAVALKSGAAAHAKYDDGVAVFTLAQQGLMFEASVGGQRFTYEPKPQ
jgi:lipid-binding SYLF domain-containing protein